MANLNLNKKPLPPAPGWGVPRRSWFWPALYLTLIPLTVVFAAIYGAAGPTDAGVFALLAGGGWVLVWFVSVVLWLSVGPRPTRRPPIVLPREESPPRVSRRGR